MNCLYNIVKSLTINHDFLLALCVIFVYNMCIKIKQGGHVMRNRIRVNISLSQDTSERLKLYAFENHTTVSGAIEQWIWQQKVKGDQIRGQRSIKEVLHD